jgi:adenosylhomocysteine nucleosidase
MQNAVIMALTAEAPRFIPRHNVFFSGVGKINAAMTATRVIEQYRPARIINFGTAGGITVSSGLHQVTQFVQRDMQCTGLGALPGETPYDSTGVVLSVGKGTGLTCSTGDNFVTSPDLEIPADLVDMEAYAIARVCHYYGVEFVCYKFVSDRANSSAHADWTVTVSTGQQLYIEKLAELGG